MTYLYLFETELLQLFRTLQLFHNNIEYFESRLHWLACFGIYLREDFIYVRRTRIICGTRLKPVVARAVLRIATY